MFRRIYLGAVTPRSFFATVDMTLKARKEDNIADHSFSIIQCKVLAIYRIPVSMLFEAARTVD